MFNIRDIAFENYNCHFELCLLAWYIVACTLWYCFFFFLYILKLLIHACIQTNNGTYHINPGSYDGD